MQPLAMPALRSIKGASLARPVSSAHYSRVTQFAPAHFLIDLRSRRAGRWLSALFAATPGLAPGSNWPIWSAELGERVTRRLCVIAPTSAMTTRLANLHSELASHERLAEFDALGRSRKKRPLERNHKR